MRLPVRCLDITSIERSQTEMERIGVDPVGIRIMAPKQFHYNLKVEGLTPAQANVIKQDMLSIGGEAAVAKGAASCAVESTDAILSGTLKHFNLLVDKLKRQSFGLPKIALYLNDALENIALRSFTIKGRSRDWVLGPRTLVMGILNVTPDSFSDGGLYFDAQRAADRALEMVEEGADWIDIGGESTRPGGEPVPLDEEIGRVMPVIKALSGRGVAISIDTTKAAVAKAALDAGAEIVNDVSALTTDKDMAAVCAEYKAPAVIMHMRGTPRTMQKDVGYGDLTGEVFNYLLSRIEFAVNSGIDRYKIIIDPGLGFGKSKEGNLLLIKNLSEFKALGRPILIGPSRKSFIGKTVGEDAADKISGTLAASVISILNGAQILRVHDVRQARKAADMADAVRGMA